MSEDLTGDLLGVNREGSLRALMRSARQLPKDMAWVELVRNAIQASTVGSKVTVHVGDGTVTDFGSGMTERQMCNHLLQIRHSGNSMVFGERFGVGARLAGIAASPNGITWTSLVDGEAHSVQMWVDESGLPRSSGPVQSEVPPELANSLSGTVVRMAKSPPGSAEKVSGLLSRRWWRTEVSIVVTRDGTGYCANQAVSVECPGLCGALTTYADFCGSVDLGDFASAHAWVLRDTDDWKARSSGVFTMGSELGPRAGIGVVMPDGEVYELSEGSNAHGRLRSFGVTAGARRVWILVFLVDGAEFEANDTRTEVRSVAAGREGERLPWRKWAAAFGAAMPAKLADYVRSQVIGSDEDRAAMLRDFLSNHAFPTFGRKRRVATSASREGGGGGGGGGNGRGNTSPRKGEPGHSSQEGTFCPRNVTWSGEEGPNGPAAWWSDGTSTLTLNENHHRLSRLTEDVSKVYPRSVCGELAKRAFEVGCVDVVAAARSGQRPDPEPSDFEHVLGLPSAMRGHVDRWARWRGVVRVEQVDH